jgi:hypothetical protein
LLWLAFGVFFPDGVPGLQIHSSFFSSLVPSSQNPRGNVYVFVSELFVSLSTCDQLQLACRSCAVAYYMS